MRPTCLSSAVVATLFILHAQHSNSATNDFFQTARLKPSSVATLAGITVTSGVGVTVEGNLWNVDVSTQLGSDMRITLDSRWGFHPTFPSTITLYLEGSTPADTFDSDGEILFVFSTSDTYFAEMISLDERKAAYKECPGSSHQLLQRDIVEMMSNAQPNRYHRFCNNSVTTTQNEAHDYWSNIASTSGISYKTAAAWPMQLSITNDPVLNTVLYGWSDDVSNNFAWRVASEFSSSFPVDQGLVIDISGEDSGEHFKLSVVDVSYTYQEATTSPTPYPSMYPTERPSQDPTTAPSAGPTSSLTLFPSHAPLLLSTMLSPSDDTITAHTHNLTDNVIRNTKIVYNLSSSASSGAGLSLLHAMLITSGTLVFVIGWVGFCVYMWYAKRGEKSVNGGSSSSYNKTRHDDDMAGKGQPGFEPNAAAKVRQEGKRLHKREGSHRVVPPPPARKKKTRGGSAMLGLKTRRFGKERELSKDEVYVSESALMAKESAHERMPDFLSIKVPCMYESSKSKYDTDSVPPITPDCNRRSVDVDSILRHDPNERDEEYSETEVQHGSETDEESQTHTLTGGVRHDMVYIPGKQTAYQEKYRARILAQQKDKQYKRYKQSIHSLDI